MTSRRGYSLVELAIAVAISSVLIFALMTLVGSMFKDLSGAFRQTGSSADVTTIEAFMLRRLALSSVMGLGLSGSNQPLDSHARFLYARPSTCADQSSGSVCSLSTALQFIALQTVSAETPVSYCWITPGVELLADAGVVSVFNSDIGTKNLLALINPPAYTAWSVAQINNVAMSDTMTGAPFSADCASRMPRESNGRFDAARFRRVQVRPVQIKGLTPMVATDVQVRFSSVFPQRIAKADIFSAGLLPSPTQPSTADAPAPTDFAVLSCQYTIDQGLSCPPQHRLASYSGIGANYVLFRYAIPFLNQPTTQEFQISGPSLPRAQECKSPFCETLPLADWSNVPYRLSGESFESLNGSGFSLIKQQLLSGLRLLLVDGQNRTYSIDFSLE